MAIIVKLKNKKSLMCGNVTLKQDVEQIVDDTLAEYLVSMYPNDVEIVEELNEEKQFEVPEGKIIEEPHQDEIPDSVDDALKELDAEFGNDDGKSGNDGIDNINGNIDNANDGVDNENGNADNMISEIMPLEDYISNMEKVSDIKNYAKEHGLVVPGNVRSRQDVIAYVITHKDELSLCEG